MRVDPNIPISVLRPLKFKTPTLPRTGKGQRSRYADWWSACGPISLQCKSSSSPSVSLFSPSARRQRDFAYCIYLHSAMLVGFVVDSFHQLHSLLCKKISSNLSFLLLLRGQLVAAQSEIKHKNSKSLSV